MRRPYGPNFRYSLGSKNTLRENFTEKEQAVIEGRYTGKITVNVINRIIHRAEQYGFGQLAVDVYTKYEYLFIDEDDIPKYSLEEASAILDSFLPWEKDDS